MKESSLDRKDILDKYTEEWSLLQDSIEWNFSRQERQIRYILIIVAVLLGLEEVAVTSLKLRLGDISLWIFASPILLVLMYRIITPMHFVSIKLSRQKDVEKQIGCLINNSRLDIPENDSPFRFQHLQFDEDKNKNVELINNPSIVLSILVSAISLMFIIYSEVKLYRVLEGGITAWVHIAIVFIISSLWIYQIYRLAKISTERLYS